MRELDVVNGMRNAVFHHFHSSALPICQVCRIVFYDEPNCMILYSPLQKSSTCKVLYGSLICGLQFTGARNCPEERVYPSIRCDAYARQCAIHSALVQNTTVFSGRGSRVDSLHDPRQNAVSTG